MFVFGNQQNQATITKFNNSGHYFCFNYTGVLVYLPSFGSKIIGMISNLKQEKYFELNSV